MKRYYRISGFVYGRLWSGGKGAYKAEQYEGKNLKALMIEIKRDLKSGALNGGMGFESLIGAILKIETIETINRKGKEFHNSEYCIEFIGSLTEEEEYLDGIESTKRG